MVVTRPQLQLSGSHTGAVSRGEPCGDRGERVPFATKSNTLHFFPAEPDF